MTNGPLWFSMTPTALIAKSKKVTGERDGASLVEATVTLFDCNAAGCDDTLFIPPK